MSHPQLSDPRNYPRVPQPPISLAMDAHRALVDWDPEGDLDPPEGHFARLHAPTSERVPPLPPVPQRAPQAEAVQVASFDTKGGVDVNYQLGFPCHSVIVDNLSNQWLFFPSARRWVAPYSYGAIIAFLQGTQVAAYRCAAPPGGGFANPAANAGETVTTTWMAAFNMPSSGTVYQPETLASATFVDGTVVAGAGATQLNGGVSLPCSSVLVQADPSNATDVYVGSSASQSIRLTAGQAEQLSIRDASAVWVKAVSGAPRVNWHARS